MKKVLNILAVVAIVFSVLLAPKPVFAGECAAGTSDPKCNPVCSSSIDNDAKIAAGCDVASDDVAPKHIENIINVAITVVGILAVFVIVVGGQRYITSNGDPGKIKGAKDMITYAVIALIVAGLAYAIVTFIGTAIGK
ncbi:hypothetical protein J6W91_01095 [Candidatus Saccharibacteria bacterium]|nr:hypothetical protein [Candidatus Saccharibacteria bacterium]